jgi:hypothetical protein
MTSLLLSCQNGEDLTRSSQVAFNANETLSGKDQILLPREFSTTLPDDIREELSFYESGGGGYVCGATEGRLIDVFPPSFHTIAGHYNSVVTVRICGFAVGEVVTYELRGPDGSILVADTTTIEVSDVAFSSPGAEIEYYFEYGTPSGNYILMLQVGEEAKSIIIPGNFIVPKAPVALRQDDLLTLHNLTPGERVRVLAYGFNKFLGWTAIAADSKGDASVSVDSTVILRLVGDVSGLIPYIYTSSPEPVSEDPRRRFFVVAPNQGRIQVVDQGRQPITELAEGDVVEVLSDGYYGVGTEIRLSSGIKGRTSSGTLLPTTVLEIRAGASTYVDAFAEWYSNNPIACLDPIPARAVLQSRQVRAKSLHYCLPTGEQYWQLETGEMVNARDVVVIEE